MTLHDQDPTLSAASWRQGTEYRQIVAEMLALLDEQDSITRRRARLIGRLLSLSDAQSRSSPSQLEPRSPESPGPGWPFGATWPPEARLHGDPGS